MIYSINKIVDKTLFELNFFFSFSHKLQPESKSKSWSCKTTTFDRKNYLS